jgi:hypothetical protein
LQLSQLNNELSELKPKLEQMACEEKSQSDTLDDLLLTQENRILELSAQSTTFSDLEDKENILKKAYDDSITPLVFELQGKQRK